MHICELLLRCGASPNMQTHSGCVTPLHRAAYCGHCHIVELLVNHCADPMITDADGKLPIHKVTEFCTKQAFVSLLHCYIINKCM